MQRILDVYRRQGHFASAVEPKIIELEQDRGVWIYEIKLLQPDGRLVKLKLDARTAQPLRRDSRDDGAGRQPDKAQ